MSRYQPSNRKIADHRFSTVLPGFPTRARASTIAQRSRAVEEVVLVRSTNRERLRLNVGGVIVTPDGRSYVYGTGWTLSDLYLVEGLR